jgi:hypothetical protein
MKKTAMMPRGRAGKALATLAVVGVAGSLAGVGAFSAFSSTTTNAGNNFTSGSVILADNDANAAMYVLTNQKPGVVTDKCIQVTYTGSLDADVKLYTTSSIGTLGPYVNMTITPGTQTTPSFPDCTGFTPAAGGAIYTGTLANFATTYPSYASGLLTYPAGVSKWTSSVGTVVYKFSVQVADNDLAQAQTTGTHTFSWQAQNQ